MPAIKVDDFTAFRASSPELRLFQNVFRFNPSEKRETSTAYKLAFQSEKVYVPSFFLFASSKKLVSPVRFIVCHPEKLPDDANSFRLRQVAVKKDFPSIFQNLPDESAPEYTLKLFENIFEFHDPDSLYLPDVHVNNVPISHHCPSTFDEKFKRNRFDFLHLPTSAMRFLH